jgi:predicted ATPase
MSADTLRRIKIEGFKTIASVDVELRPINIVIGANGSGKSNFLIEVGLATIRAECHHFDGWLTTLKSLVH